MQAGVGSLPVDPVVDILAGESELPDRLFFIFQAAKVTIRSVGLINNDQQVTFPGAVEEAVLGSLALALEKVLHVRHQLIFAVHDAQQAHGAVRIQNNPCQHLGRIVGLCQNSGSSNTPSPQRRGSAWADSETKAAITARMISISRFTSILCFNTRWKGGKVKG